MMTGLAIVAALLTAQANAKEERAILWRVTHSVNVAVDSLPSNCVLVAFAGYHSLPGPPTVTWKNIISMHSGVRDPKTGIVRLDDANHVYLVFVAFDRMQAWDRTGAKIITPKTRNARDVAEAIQEVFDGKVVASAGYYDESEK